VSELSRVAKLIGDLWRLDQDIAKQEDLLNRMKSKRAMLATVDLPEAMTEMGSTTTITNSGFKCVVAHKIYGSLPSRDNPDARMAAIEYLKSHDGAELIRANVKVEFGKGDIRGANKFRRFLMSHTREPVTVDSEVHPMSLQAWGRERIKQNLPLDLSIVGLRGQTIAEVKKVDNT